MKLNLFVIATLFIIGIGCFMLGISLPDIARIIQGTHWRPMNTGLAFMLFCGIGFTTAGIMMLMRLKTSIAFATFMLLVSMIGWILFFIIKIYPDSGGEKIFIYSLSLFLLIFLFVLILLVNNDKVVASIGAQDQEDFGDDILDKL